MEDIFRRRLSPPVGGAEDPRQTAGQIQAQAIWELLALREGGRALDAPCGYGRFSLPLARRGAIVVGVDQSAELLAKAEIDRAGLLPIARAIFRHDLREPLREGRVQRV